MGISDMQKADMKSQSKHKDNDYDLIMASTSCMQRCGASSTTRKRYYDFKMNKAIVTMSVLLCLATLVSGAAGGACPAHCSCRSNQVAFCNNKGFTTTPTDLTSSIEELYLFNNNITTMPKESMRPLTKLRILDISGNRITNYALWEGAFSEFQSLENLMLQDNQITKITVDMFKGLKKLARIYLQGNKISSISDGAFDNLENLVELKLQNNRLVSFPKLENTPRLLLLDLRHNKLRTIRDMALSTVNVEQLLLGDNQLTQLRTSIFDDTSRLSILDISNNRLTAVPQIIKSLTGLRTLNMSLNKIDSIPQDTFKKLERLKTLDLHGMRLTTLSDNLLPLGVILNVFDITDNNWECGCSMSWLPPYISIFGPAFTAPGRIICAGPPNVKGRQLKDLSSEELDCKGEDKPVDPPVNPPPAQPTTTLSTTTTRPYIINPCDVYPCFNGGRCIVEKQHTGKVRPRCECRKDWAGPQCQTSLTTPTSTTTTTTTTTAKQKENPAGRPQLFINSESITQTSVEIILPQTDTEFLVSVSEIGQDDKPTELKIKPMAHPFTVKGLQSGRLYNICIHSPVARDRTIPSYLPNRDSLCGTVKTDGNPEKDISIESPIGPINPDRGSKDPETAPERPTVGGGSGKDNVRPGDDGKLTGVSNPVTTTSESGDFQILYPALGAGLGAVIIVVMLVMFFFCYRQKRRLKMKHQHSEYIPGSPTDTTQSADVELATVVHHHHHNHYPAVDTEGNSAKAPTKKAGTATRKAPNQPSSSVNNNGKPRHVITPNQTSSLGRSSSSSNSNCGTLQTRYAETPQHYPPPQQQYITAGPPPHPPYEMLHQTQINGRGNEYIYKNHQNNNNSAVPMGNSHYLSQGRPYETEIPEDIQPLVGGMNHYNYSPVEGQMYVDNYGAIPLQGPQYHPQSGGLSYPMNSRSAFQPIQSPRKNSVRTPTSESGPITTHVNTAHVLPTSTCMSRNLMNESIPVYPEGVPVA